MEHLIAVLWEDYWQPWLASAARTLGHLSLVALVLGCLLIGYWWVAAQVIRTIYELGAI